ncbi:MAG TPA: ribosomal RNA small subunit methyltransferase A [Desulfobulbaceae bacterium]|nr:ribosomal RNA small subunit methyltransferase A [Desulfobulbaceae bacterium]
MAYQNTRATLQSRGLAPHKRLGQNFLVHRHTAERIVALAAPGEDDTVVEVGVGLGALTNPIAARVRRVIGIEADSGIVQLHRDKNDLAANVELVHGDILQVDLAELAARSGGSLKFIANLPYSISSPFLFRLLEHREKTAWAVVMLQKEVAERLMASPGTREYGIPSVLFAGCATIEPLLLVKPDEFHPRPKVDSLVIRIRFQPPPPCLAATGPADWPLLQKIVHSCFGQRRKTLRNGLAASGLVPDKKLLDRIIAQAGLSPTIRAEQLSFAQFSELARCLGGQFKNHL